MKLTKETIIDKIEILKNGNIQVRQAIMILEDGNLLSQSFHRYVLQPEDDLTNEDSKVVAIANVIWNS